jgi:RluA family pseudouridine synthase
MPFEILHHDSDLIAVNKPEGIAAVPEHAQDPDCLLERLGAQIGQRLLPVHRLDKDVSGVILYACHAASHRFLNAAFAEHRVYKTYLALVHGAVVPDHGTIDQPIREFGSGRMGVSPAGKPSRTEFRVLERFGAYTLVEATPRTGRRHQLRVHLYHLGHPIVGDRRYGQRAVQEHYPRLMLHALAIDLPHPAGHRLTLRDCPSATFQHALAAARQSGAPPPPEE